MEKNNVKSVNTTPANTAIDKENVMDKHIEKFEIESAVECCLITGTIGFTLPLVTTLTDRLVMNPGDVAFLVILVHIFTNVIAGGMLSDIQTKTAKAIVGGFFLATSLLVGTALFRCLVEGISNGLPVDYASLPAFIIVGGTVLMSAAVAGAFAASVKFDKK